MSSYFIIFEQRDDGIYYTFHNVSIEADTQYYTKGKYKSDLMDKLHSFVMITHFDANVNVFVVEYEFEMHHFTDMQQDLLTYVLCKASKADFNIKMTGKVKLFLLNRQHITAKKYVRSSIPVENRYICACGNKINKVINKNGTDYSFCYSAVSRPYWQLQKKEDSNKRALCILASVSIMKTVCSTINDFEFDILPYFSL